MKNSPELAKSIQKLQHNEAAIKAIRELFPEQWTHPENLNVLPILFGLKLNGVDWRSPSDFGAFMVLARAVGIVDCDKLYLVRRGTSEIKSVPLKYLAA